MSEIEKKEGIDIPEPVWTVGRLDERASRAEAPEAEAEAPEAEAESKESRIEDAPAEGQGDAADDQDCETI